MSFAAAIPLIGKVLDRILPDKAASEAAKIRMVELAQAGQLAELDAEVKLQLAAAENVKAEAQSNSWLTSSWRPVTMLTFTGLIVARFFGWTAPNISEVEYVALWNIVQIGIGGYTIGRSAEKLVPAIVAAVKQK